MKRRRTAITVVVVLIGVLAGASLAVAVPAPVGATINAEPETQSHVVTTGSVITATVTNGGAPVSGADVFWTESGPGDLVRTDATTNASGQAFAVATSRQAGDQIVTAWLDAPGATCVEPATPLRCDNTKVTWTAKQTANQPALECSGGAYGALVDPVIGPAAEVPDLEEPCPTMGSTTGTTADPKVRRETVLDVPLDPVVFVGVADARSEFTSDHSESTARVAGVEALGMLGIEVAGSRATSQCAPNGVATQELDGGQVVITDTNGTPDDPSDDTIVFSGIAPPNTEIPLDPLINIKLNEQIPEDPADRVGPELPGEKQDRHAEGEVNAVHIQVLTSPVGPLIDIVLGHAESDITCKQHGFAIDLEPEDQTVPITQQATVTATVTDEAGRPVVGEDVTWTETGEGDFVSTQNRTDMNGQATATLSAAAAGDETVTATLSNTKTKCSIAAGGICTDSVVIHWTSGGPPPPPASILRFFGHAHTDYDGDNAVHLTKNDRGDVHVAGNLRDNLLDTAPPFGPLGYWDLRDDPPGQMQDEFRCEKFTPQTMERTGPVGANQVTIKGFVGRCNKSQRDPDFRTFELIIQDNGTNPPNQDAYRMTFFANGGQVIYQWQAFTTVGLGDLTIELV
jgi:hypothetical protein